MYYIYIYTYNVLKPPKNGPDRQARTDISLLLYPLLWVDEKNNNEPLLGMVGDGLWHWVYHFTIIKSLCFSHKLVYNPINYGSNPCKP